MLCVLGAVRLDLDTGAVPVGGPKPQALASVLVAHAGHTVPPGKVIEALWEAGPPRSARSLVHTYVSTLRGVLRRADDLDITHRAGGYVLHVPPGMLDSEVFERRVAHARQAERAGRHEAAADGYRHALRLWGGDPFGGLPTPVLQAEAHRLRELHLSAREGCVDNELASGHGASLVPELRSLVDSHPLRERLWVALMTALVRAGRQADALAAFDTASTLLREELGTAPGKALRQARDDIVSGTHRVKSVPVSDEPEPSRHGSSIIPQELPPDVGGFVGREDTIRAAMAELDGGRRIVSVSGCPGVGKTALSLHIGHLMAGRFPDGRLFTDLRGFSTAEPAVPAQVLARHLRALGVRPERIPERTEERATLMRSVLAGRRVLIVLDDAASAEQIRPLLPGGGPSAVLVTSRNVLRGLAVNAGARLVNLDVLDHEDAVRVVADVAGPDTVRESPEAADELARVCGGLPLALRIAAANVAARPHGALREQVEALRTTGLRSLGVSDEDGLAVRAVFDQSFASLPQDSRSLFVLLGPMPGHDVTAHGAAALADVDVTTAARLLDELAGANLVQECAPGRYRQHDLLSLYAREHAAERPEAERDAPARRLLEWYRDTTESAAAALDLPVGSLRSAPPVERFDGREAALGWLDGERDNLVAAVHDAAARASSTCWELADAVRGYLHLRTLLDELADTAETAARAAGLAANGRAAAAMRRGVGLARWRQGHFVEARDHLDAALSLSLQDEWNHGAAMCRFNLGLVHHTLGSPGEAMVHFGLSADGHRACEDPVNEAMALHGLGNVHRDVAEFDQALRCHSTAAALHAKAGSPLGEAYSLASTGEVHHLLGAHSRAREDLDQARARFRAVDGAALESGPLRTLALLCLETGEFGEADDHARTSLELARQAGERAGEAETRAALAALALARGENVTARDEFARALREAEELHHAPATATALVGLATARLRCGESSAARDTAERAVDHVHRHGLRAWEADALAAVGEVDLAEHRAHEALRRFSLAADLHRRTGRTTRHAAATQLRGEALLAAGRPCCADYYLSFRDRQ